MKVLLISLYHPELVRGGAQQVCYELFKGLKRHHGIEPVLLAAIDPSFKALYKSGARITGFDGRSNEFLFLSRDYDYTWHKASCHALIESYVEFLRLTRPDVIHFHHFLLLGIDLLTVTRRELPSARIIFTFHEFMAICDAEGHMLRRVDNSLCSHASAIRCHQCFPEQHPEHFFLRDMWFKRHLAAVDAFTVPSQFMIERYVLWGLDRKKIRHITNGQPNYSDGSRFSSEKRQKRNRFGFFGQLVDNKGVWLLLQAVDLLRAQGFTDFIVEINGDNLKFASDARRSEIEAFLSKEGERPAGERNVFFNGSYSVDQLGQRMNRIDWCLVPSVWWEVFGLVISEAWMFGRPVIASNVGGPAERISDGVNGLLFDIGDCRSLANVIQRCSGEKGLWERLVKGIPTPTGTEQMVDGFLLTYKWSRKMGRSD